MNTSFLRIAFTAALVGLLAVASSAKSPKRGVGWDERTMKLNSHHAELFKPGVSWVYNWGPDAANSDAFDSELRFEPMAWNAAYDAGRIRSWIKKHPETRYLLGFNEPNFDDQAKMTPAQAAEAWPALEKLAAELGLKLVAPALNFSASQVGGRVWNPYEWYDEFFRLYPSAKVDCLALHCYMNWYSAATWFATEYFYADLYNPAKECYGRYPNLVKFMDAFKAANGKFPPMMLTEFCAWENDGTIKNVDFQIDQMCQKIQKLEQSELVEGYAWFMANPAGGAAEYPYMSLLQSNTATSGLSELGTVFVYMSDFDTERYYSPGELIAAKDYVDATTDDRQIKLRSNSENGSSLPLQLEVPVAGYADYLLDVPADGEYKFVFHVKAEAEASLTLYVDSKKGSSAVIEPTSGQWTDVSLVARLSQGKHRMMPYNSGSAPFFMNSLRFTAADGIEPALSTNGDVVAVYGLCGVSKNATDIDALTRGVYIKRHADGSTTKFVK